MKKLASLLLTLALCAGLAVPALAAGFSDVAERSPFAPAIAWAVEKGVTKGTTPTTFGPGETCTTSHILTFLWRAAGRPGDTGNERASVPSWAAGLGIDVSDLSAPCTRAAAVTDIWKAQGSPAAGTGTLANGKPITEENVLAIIQELLKKYPHGMTWGDNTYRQESPSAAMLTIEEEQITAEGLRSNVRGGCGGFASLVSDSIFGSGNANPARKIPVEYVRPGDIIILRDADGNHKHYATAASRITGIDEYGDGVSPILTVYDGNANGKIRYYTYFAVPKTYSAYNGYYVEVWTRYPTDGTPWTGSSDSSGASEQPSSELSGGASGSEVNWVTTDNKCGVCGKIGGRQVRSADGGRYVCEDCYNDPTGVGKWYVE